MTEVVPKKYVHPVAKELLKYKDVFDATKYGFKEKNRKEKIDFKLIRNGTSSPSPIESDIVKDSLIEVAVGIREEIERDIDGIREYGLVNSVLKKEYKCVKEWVYYNVLRKELIRVAKKRRMPYSLRKRINQYEIKIVTESDNGRKCTPYFEISASSSPSCKKEESGKFTFPTITIEEIDERIRAALLPEIDGTYILKVPYKYNSEYFTGYDDCGNELGGKVDEGWAFSREKLEQIDLRDITARTALEKLADMRIDHELKHDMILMKEDVDEIKSKNARRKKIYHWIKRRNSDKVDALVYRLENTKEQYKPELRREIAFLCAQTEAAALGNKEIIDSFVSSLTHENYKERYMNEYRRNSSLTLTSSIGVEYKVELVDAYAAYQKIKLGPHGVQTDFTPDDFARQVGQVEKILGITEILTKK